MKIDGANINSGLVWSSDTAVRRGEKVDFADPAKPANADRFVLNLPAAETVYKRQEFTADESMGTGCAFCYTYMERTLEFENGGKLTIVSDKSEDGCFVINSDKDGRTFAGSGVDMDGISRAVEETWERTERSLEQAAASGSLSGTVSGGGFAAGGSLGFAAQASLYRHSSVRETKGAVSFKNGGTGVYRENAVSSRELYNKCAVFLADAFGAKSAGLVLGEKAFNELFGEQDGGGETVSESGALKREKLNSRLDSLKEFMEKSLADVRRKDPGCGSLKAFADTRLKIGKYKYSDIVSLAEKMFAAENV
ncbi:MAG: hypothetical protein NC395_01660 [Prevotella sp.]|nr:hypothetical protein [Prevotella sp.]